MNKKKNTSNVTSSRAKSVDKVKDTKGNSKRGKSEERASKVKNKKSTKEKVKDPNAPKKPKSGYILYSLDERPDVKKDGFEGKEILAEIGKRWNTLDASEKQKYEKMANDEKARYEAELEEYKNNMDDSRDSSDSEVKNKKNGKRSYKEAHKGEKAKGGVKKTKHNKKVESDDDDSD